MTDDVNGTVIGEVTTDKYVTFHCLSTGTQVIPGQWFADDGEAVGWAKEHYPSLFAKGLEMCVHG